VTQFIREDLQGPSFERVDLSGAQFRNVELSLASFLPRGISARVNPRGRGTVGSHGLAVG
jgi:uncharacterized protein YjbI with pentapeptide repeats